ncbi:Calcineurin B-like protein [Melia azedarach]|uniref:Calcineurin B-like protein n=1 Tax=Melia azedarach TaxID=155640 RepID=A0ACC1Y2H5_MELAZ|nr:Calcineurin B-like protein [Melia azedarach]
MWKIYSGEEAINMEGIHLGSSSSYNLWAVFLPFISLIEDLIFSLTGCFDHQRPPKLHYTFNDLVRIANNSPFNINEVEALHELFKKLSGSIIDDGLIHKEELRLALLKTTAGENLFLDRVFDLFDEKKNGVIEFEEFVRALSIFHPSTPLDDKIDFAFKLYDLRQTGYIEKQEVDKANGGSHIARTGLKLSNGSLRDIIDQKFLDADIDRDGKINKEEWNSFSLRHPALLKNTTLPFLKNITTVFPSFIFNTGADDREFGCNVRYQEG